MSLEVLTYENGRLLVLDQTRLPMEARYVALSNLEQVEHAITSLTVRGAPLIGLAAAYGVCVALLGRGDRQAAQAYVPEVFRRLRASRPTAVNLFWALGRMEAAVQPFPVLGWERALEEAARAIHMETLAQDRALVANGLPLLAAGSNVITHCNTGALATGGLGTALGVLMEAHRQLGQLHVYVDETRPRWQGAHLTTWELARAGVPFTLMADSAAAFRMAQGDIHSVWVGADRIAANGDTANKIGTYSLALAAAAHGVLFYVVAPTSTIDLNLATGDGIPIEERASEEITAPGGRTISPLGTGAWNPAFDITPARLIAAIVTERDVFRGPQYDLRNALESGVPLGPRA